MSAVREVVRLVADALAWLLAAYGAVHAELLAVDGVLSGTEAAVRTAACLGVVGALAYAADRRAPRGRRARRVLLAVALVAGVAQLLARVAAAPPAGGGSFAWLALEWAKLPANAALTARVSPWAAVLAAGIALALVALAVARRSPLEAGAFPAAAGAAVVAALDTIGAEERVVVYWTVFAAPWLLATLGLVLAWPRLTARAALVACTMSVVLVHYLGWLPLARSELGTLSGVRRIALAGPDVDEVPLAFLRSFAVGENGEALYSAYGPTSGLLRVHLASGALEVVPTPNDLVRFVWTDPGQDEVLALEWVHGDLLRIAGDPFGVVERQALIAPGRAVPMAFAAGRERLAVVFSELPALLEVERATGRPLRTLDLRASGVTRYRSGAWSVAGDVDAGFVVVVAGAVDEAGRYVLARVALDSFSVERTAALADGGLALAYVRERSAVYAAGFFTRRLFEYDAATLAPGRTLEVPLNVRALAYDPVRDVLWALGFLSGELAGIDLATGRTRCRVRVGNKALSLAFDGPRDRLLVGSAAGIHEVDLGAFHAPGAPCAAALP